MLSKKDKEILKSNKIEIQEFYSNNGIPGDFVIVQMCLTKQEFRSLNYIVKEVADAPGSVIAKDIHAYMNNAIYKANLYI